MTEQKFERLSALVDDEISEHEISGEINKLKNTQESQDIWSRYHLIGDAMRNELGHIHDPEMARSISQRIENEPIVLAPAALKPRSSNKKRAFTGLAVAASLTAAAVVMAPQLINPGSSEAPNQLASSDQLPISNQRPESNTIYVAENGTRWKLLKKPKVESRLNDYLLNHQDLSPSSNIKGIMPYATFVSYDENKQ
ncbi:MAG: sigma-E factor negative regulatory protein [Candidatus Thiodiazotropha sp. (ex Cardiolucina cf. quadrata)]|nr:sigma-E factor negative regulatory protein [Candidatus Thiodiazotropha sp. (ex Cardiolucina cf. quadrata)]